ncbi:MAG: hypothetical protein ACI85O_003205 [Saprospiraceae bacterium]|jgi:hypothetical protein
MSFIHDLKVKYHNYKFSKATNSLRAKRASVDFDRAETVGLLFDATELNNREIVLKFAKSLENKGKKVRLLGFVNIKEETDNLAFPNFNLKSLNLALMPESSTDVQEFMKKDFDILINLSLDETVPLEYIAALSNAKFRVGPFTERTVCYELMIDVTKRKSLDAFIHQAQFFLEKMNKQEKV